MPTINEATANKAASAASVGAVLLFVGEVGCAGQGADGMVTLRMVALNAISRLHPDRDRVRSAGRRPAC